MEFVLGILAAVFFALGTVIQQKVAEEIRRRRAMRRDMAEQASGQPKQ